MRVVHVISTPRGIGGAERTLIGLVQKGKDLGWDQLVLNPFRDRASTPELQDAVAPVTYTGLAFDGFQHLRGLRRRLRDELLGFNPDIIHTHLFHAAVLTASVRSPGPALITTHQHGSFYAGSGKRLQDHLDGWASRRMHRVVAISEHVADFVQRHHGVAKDRIVLIPNGWTGTPMPRHANPSRPTVTAIGNLRKEKGHEVLLEAFALLVRDFPPARLVLAGDGPLRMTLETRVRELGLDGSVQFKGWIDDVWQLLAETDVYVMPSHNEALGLAAIEAMAAGVPVVASSVGGLKDLITEGETGLLVEPGDHFGLAGAVGRILADAALARSLQERGRVEASSFRLERVVERYKLLYENLRHPKAPQQQDGPR